MADILMPRLSDTMEEGTITRWLKHPGDQVAKGDVIAEIQTDKATMDLEAFETGVLERLVVDEGATVPIGEPVAVVGSLASEAPRSPAAPPTPTAPSTSTAPAAKGGPATAAGDPAGEPATQAPMPHVVPTTPQVRISPPLTHRRPPRSSPLARSLARRHGLDVADIPGSGPGGRVVRTDVEAAVAARGDLAPMAPHPAPAPTAPTASAGGDKVEAPAASAAGDKVEAPTAVAVDVDEIPLSRTRRITAERLTQSAQAPHFFLTSIVEAEALLALRSEINQLLGSGAAKATITDLLVMACAKTLRHHPEVNSSWGGDKLTIYHRVHIGIAVAVHDGLVVPVIHDADGRTLTEIAAEAHTLAEAARQDRLTLDQLTGGTFTISNLGMYGIDHFTAVINPPQAAILAVGAATPAPVVREGQVVAGTTMKLTLSVDHRVLDGATAAGFLSDLHDTLERPLTILV